MLKNYQDDRCKWGYITLCELCAMYVASRLLYSYRHIHIDKPVTDVPVAEKCELCGGR
jgi:hypothetical protein